MPAVTFDIVNFDSNRRLQNMQMKNITMEWNSKLLVRLRANIQVTDKCNRTPENNNQPLKKNESSLRQASCNLKRAGCNSKPAGNSLRRPVVQARALHRQPHQLRKNSTSTNR